MCACVCVCVLIEKSPLISYSQLLTYDMTLFQESSIFKVHLLDYFRIIWSDEKDYGYYYMDDLSDITLKTTSKTKS